MKLVEILARDLKEWPLFVDNITQSKIDSEIYAWDGRDTDTLRSLKPKPFYLSAMHTQAAYQNVTRAEWQAAVDVLKEKEVVEWDGVGLPPVGAVVRSAAVGNPFFEAFRDMDLQVVFHDHNQDGEPIAVFRYPDPEESMEVENNGEGYASWLYHGMVSGMFRPIRTPEQIAAEEREKAIREMCEHGVSAGERTIEMTAAALYDAGYRKQEQN